MCRFAFSKPRTRALLIAGKFNGRLRLKRNGLDDKIKMPPINCICFFILILLSFLSQIFSILRNESELTTHCYNFPAKDFGKVNNVKTVHGSSPALILKVGDLAIDFTVPTSAGELINLATLLSEKPVVLIWGHYTCPAWQGLNSDTMFIGSSFEEEYTFVESVKDKVTVVHLIGPEPHPIWPHANFDSGSLKMNMWSTIR